MIRLFIALPLKKEVEEKLNNIISQLKPYGGTVKYVKPENIHLTLKFLGDTEENLIDQIKLSIDSVTSSFKPIKSELIKIGTFPNWNRPRVIWVGMDKNKNQFEKLSSQIDTELEKSGWPKDEKGFRAHLTLGRVKNNRDLHNLIKFAQSYKLEPFALEFDRVVLYQSTLTKLGPIYKELHVVNLTERFE